MTTPEILNHIGQFSDLEKKMFENQISYRTLKKNEILLKEGEVCSSFYYIIKGSIYQFQIQDISEIIIDLHLQDEWIFNQQSLVEQSPSNTTIKAFSDTAILELSLECFHYLASISSSFLQFGKILNPAQDRTHIFDNSLNPTERYDYIKKSKPLLVKAFPVKMIASYLKMAPETLSRVRANY